MSTPDLTRSGIAHADADFVLNYAKGLRRALHWRANWMLDSGAQMEADFTAASQRLQAGVSTSEDAELFRREAVTLTQLAVSRRELEHPTDEERDQAGREETEAGRFSMLCDGITARIGGQAERQ